MAELMILESDDYSRFRTWIALDMESLTWQGRFQKEFEEFWLLFFVDGLSLRQINERFQFASSVIKVGPLLSWFDWLEGKLLAYVFIFKDISLEELAQNFDCDVNELAYRLRSFMTEAYPLHEEKLSESFLIGNMASENLNLRFSILKNELGVEGVPFGGHDDEILSSLEVTLYDEWADFLSKMKKNFLNARFDIRSVRERAQIKNYFKIFLEAIAVLVVSLFLVYGTIEFNRWYEKSIGDKISIYEPQFRWSEGVLSFQPPERPRPTEDFKLDIDDIENVDDGESFLGESLSDEERFDVESEVVLTSSDDLPRNIEVADLEQSDYEEQKQKGYRDTRYGNTKVYRVIMNAPNAEETNQGIKSLLDQYSVRRVDNVKPGLSIPGGHYYNLYVSRPRLKEFMAELAELSEAVIYESRTRTRKNPPGENKVFIWVKSI